MEPEEAHRNSMVIPLNMQPAYTAPREVFDEYFNPYEQPQVRLKPRQPTNEIISLPLDDVSRTCPQLLPPEPVVVPPGICQGGPPTNAMWGDGYINNFAVQPLPQPLLMPQPVLPFRNRAPRWYFPRIPAQGRLRPTPRPAAALGPVGGGATCGPGGAGQLRLAMEPPGAGAITSIRVGGFEYLRRHQGGQVRRAALQLSVAANVPPGGHDQQRRANEAGAAWNTPASSSSRVLNMATGRITQKKVAAFTRTQAAWWRKPGSAIDGRYQVLNTTDVSPYHTVKRVTVGPTSFKYVGGVTVPASDNPVSLRIATSLALRAGFNRALAFHYPSQRWVALPRSRTLPVGRYRALAVSNRAGTRAIGVSLMDFPKPPAGWNFNPKAYYAVNVTGKATQGTVLSVVHQVGVRGGAQLLPARTYAYHQHFEVGSLQKVTRNLANLAINLTPESQQWRVPRGWRRGRFGHLCRAPARRTWVDRGVLSDPSKICGPRPGAVQRARAARLRAMRAQGWRRVNGVWRRPGWVCRMKRAPVRCRKCSMRNLHLPRCAGCVACRRRRPPAAAPADYQVFVPPVGQRCTVRRAARCRGCNVGMRNVARCRGCVACARCRVINRHVPRCKRCTLAKKNLPVCRGCIACGAAAAPQPKCVRTDWDARGIRGRCRRCTVAQRGLARCKGCFHCRQAGGAPAPAGPVVRCRKTDWAAAGIGARCRNCAPGDHALARCKGCYRCVCPRVKTYDNPAHRERCMRCTPAQRDLGRCRGCFACGGRAMDVGAAPGRRALAVPRW